MIVIAQQNNRNRAIPLDRNGRDFRYDFVVQPNDSLVFKKTFFNPYWNYVITTLPLESGRHLFKIVVVDNYGNFSDERSDGVDIVAELIPPRNIEIEASGNDVTITWVAPIGINVDGYKIYGNNGSGVIKRNTALAVVPSSQLTITFAGLANGDWRFVVESYSGVRETVSYQIVEAYLPTTSEVPPAPTEDPVIFQPSPIFSENVSVGKIHIIFFWFYGAKASHFRLYHDSGTGTVDYTTYQRFERARGELQEFTTTQIYTERTVKEFKFVVRAESSSGVVDTNTNEYTATLDGIKPNAVIGFDVESKD